MTEITPREQTPSGANVIVKPPQLFFSAIVAGLLLQWFWPLSIASHIVTVLAGLSLISGSLGLMFWADGTFKRWETAVNPEYPTTTLIQTGPYRFSRNPMYLAFILIQLGIGLAVSSWWLLLTLLPTWIVLRWGVIAREERYLTALFGEQFRAYQTAVRRWL